MALGSFNFLPPQANQFLTPFLPLSMQPLSAVQSQTPYDNASQHFKTGAYPWMGDNGATQADTGLYYLTSAIKDDFARTHRNQGILQQQMDQLVQQSSRIQQQNDRILALLGAMTPPAKRTSNNRPEFGFNQLA